MKFGETLQRAVHPPWASEYIDYKQLKKLLREDAPQSSNRPWTADDEEKFVDETLHVQLDKVAHFQKKTFESLERRADVASEKLKALAPEEGKPRSDVTAARFKVIQDELDTILNDARELRKYASINYTAFQKIIKKHDRKRGNSYKLKPVLQVRLEERPFNSEQAYAPLDNKISIMYFIIRQQLEEESDAAGPSSDPQSQSSDKYTARKFWVDEDNLLEVKTFLLRRLPSLVYSAQSSKGLNAQGDPAINSIYLDNSQFSLYDQKRNKEPDASSVRIRWYGQLKDAAKDSLVIEMKTILGNGSSEEKRFTIKEKYVQDFIDGKYHMEKSVDKMERQGQPKEKVESFKQTVNDIQKFILDNDLQPMLRANYTRTAYQKPGDDRVRISIDNSLAFIREDCLDQDRPCRLPGKWHRDDIDNKSMAYPYPDVNQGEIKKFPHAVLEIKVRDKAPQWIEDLMASHLVFPAPGFSKFLQGAVSLFEDRINDYPSWHKDLDIDIHRDPKKAYEENQAKQAQVDQNTQFVGSFVSSALPSSSRPARSSPLSKGYMQERFAEEQQSERTQKDATASREERGQVDGPAESQNTYGGLPAFSLSRYAQSRREKNVVLPPGVTKPESLLKDAGPLQVEPKVWLANERTFLKWQHICLLMGSLAITLYTSAGTDRVAEVMGFIYLLIAAFAGGWGLYMQQTRREMIIARSGKDFDNWIGPMVVSFALMAALIINFAFKFQDAMDRYHANDAIGQTMESTIAQLPESYRLDL